MVIDHSYKISVFGDFTDIVPTADNMLYLINSFREYDMFPSVFQELMIDANAPQPVQMQRIALISSDNKEQLTITSNRMDYQITANDDIKLDISQRELLNNKICAAYEIVLDYFKKQSSRLALNAENSIINLSPEQAMAFISRYTNPISIFNEKELIEWNTRLMTKGSALINEINETLNIIAIIAKTITQKLVDGQILNSEGFMINTDINTIAENSTPRFSKQAIIDFVNISMDLWDKIIDEVG